MTTSRIKEKISALVSSQLPEFIQSDFPTFVEFIEAYYRFLEQDQGASELLQNARSYNDIDRTTNDFVQYFLNTYAKNIPQGLLGDNRLLVKKIKDLYQAKGSELSFKLLFRILFDSEVSIRVPFENVLRSSGGNWQQNFSIRVETTTGDRNDLANRIIRHTAGGVIFNTPIVRVKILTSSLTELFLDSAFLSSSYSVGDTIEVYQNSTLIFSGTISPTTTSFTITQPGLGFKVGQLYIINFASGVNTIVKVNSVNSSGGVTGLKFLNYGYGFSSSPGFFTVTLDPTKAISESVSFLLSKTQGFGSKGFVSLIDPSSPENYFLEDYVSPQTYTLTSIAQTFNNDVFNPQQTTQQTVPANFSIVKFNVGALASYPGSYFTDQSFISEFEVRLQDDELYQPFAYQTVTEVDIEDFFDIVKKLINPAGQTLFNNRTLFANVDISASLVVTPISNISFEAYDSFEVLDPNILDISKSLSDQQTVNDPFAFTFSKPTSSNVASVSSVNTFSLNKTISDTSNVTDPFIAVVSYNRVFDDTANAVVLTFNTLTKSINNNESNVSLSESGILEIQDYFEESISRYVNELYVGGSFNII
jgi:hypothetical protein